MNQDSFAVFCFEVEEGTVRLHAVENDPEGSKQSLVKMQKGELLKEFL